ncbi:MAG: ribonuclease P protein component [Thiotrichaceae bacterium]
MDQNPEPATFPRDYRLTEAKQYQQVFAGSSRFGNRYITVLAKENQQEHPRLGMAISKKCAKRAVDRNRIKRVIRESFRVNCTTLPSVDMVVMCRPLILELDNSTLFQQIETQWSYIRKKMGSAQHSEAS